MLSVMDLRFRIKTLHPKVGNPVEIPTKGVTCIVGRNNVGKTRLLNDIMNLITRRGTQPIVISHVEVEKTENLQSEDLEAWLEENHYYRTDRLGQERTYQTSYGSNLTLPMFHQHWIQADPALDAAVNFVAWYSPAGHNINIATQAATSNPELSGAPSNMQKLWIDGSLERKLSDLAYETFGVRLLMDRVTLPGGMLRVGQVDIPRPGYNDSTVEYYQAISDLPYLNEQGEGMKSFLGLALEVMEGPAQLLLVDEPEAFLHPGQARALGRWLAKEAAKNDKQIILATHDRDIVVGLLDGGAEAGVSIVRVERKEGGGGLMPLTSAQVATLWDDPVMRYSNVLQGLFHARVVICEGDADCRFYAAVFDHLMSESDSQAIYDDTLFVPSAGKGGVSKFAESLTAIGVEATAIIDFDGLFVKKQLLSIVHAVGGSLSLEALADLQRFYDFFNTLDDAKKKALQKQGVSGVDPGRPTVAVQNLIAALAEQRVLVVESGEMEDLDKSCAGDSSVWVNAMLGVGRHKTCEPARRLVGKIQLGQEISDPTLPSHDQATRS